MVCGSAMLAIAAINGSRLWAVGACAVLCLIGLYFLAAAIRQSSSALHAEGAARSA